MDEDIKAINSVLAGDADAFEHIVRRYQHILLDLAGRLLGSTEEAEDAVQCAFVKMYSCLADYDQKRPFLNWAYTITLNIARNRLRRQQILSFIPFVTRGRGDDADAQQIEPEEHGAAPELRLSADMLRKDLGQAVSGLSYDLRAPFVLFHMHQRQAKEIAVIMGLTPNAVSIRLFKARAQLMKELAPKYPEQFRACDGAA